VEGLDLDSFYLFHAVRGDLLRRVGRTGDTALACDAAVAGTDNAREREFLSKRRAALRAESFRPDMEPGNGASQL
jgi:RNA polymerase sigma-70 factor, ECF subfamily